jgi:beta-galactosidase/beta-glucuronidase
MNSGKWTTIDVPSQWEQQGFGAYNYGQGDPISRERGLYKHPFSAPKSWQGKVVQIVFEGSMTDTEVKVNGVLAGPIHQGAFYQFRYDISKLLKYGADNLLEVNVSKESADSSVNRAERRGDYWDFGGIFRPVYLEIVPKAHISRVAIDAKANGSFSMNVFLEGVEKAAKVRAQLQTLEGKSFGKPITVNVPIDADMVQLTGLFDKPALWTPETPKLYRVVVQLKGGKTINHRFSQTFGFRTVEVRPSDGIYVNGVKVLFKGVCRHTFWPESGRCSSK